MRTIQAVAPSSHTQHTHPQAVLIHSSTPKPVTIALAQSDLHKKAHQQMVRVQFLGGGKALTTHQDGSKSTSNVYDPKDHQNAPAPVAPQDRVRVAGYSGTYRFSAADGQVTQGPSDQMITTAQVASSPAGAESIEQSARHPVHGNQVATISDNTLVTVRGIQTTVAGAIRAGLVQRNAHGQLVDSGIVIEPTTLQAVDTRTE